jgi:hypothetical protein
LKDNYLKSVNPDHSRRVVEEDSGKVVFPALDPETRPLTSYDRNKLNNTKSQIALPTYHSLDSSIVDDDDDEEEEEEERREKRRTRGLKNDKKKKGREKKSVSPDAAAARPVMAKPGNRSLPSGKKQDCGPTESPVKKWVNV